MSADLSNKIIFVKNLPARVTGEELYDIFWRYGTVLQIRKGTVKEKRGSAIVVYSKEENARKAVEELNGFNIAGKFITCAMYHFQYKSS
jgi:pre-mRNA branch site protein p14